MQISQKKLYIVEVLCQLVNVNFPDFAQRAAFFKNIADLHCLIGVIRIGFKRNGDKIAAVKFFADNAGAEGVAVQTNHKVRIVERSAAFMVLGYSLALRISSAK